MSTQHKALKLGMNPSTASGRLIKDLLWSFVSNAGHNCYRCDQPMTRDTFSVDHKISWLNSSEPLTLFFDVSNIGYSHISCNSRASVKLSKYSSPEASKTAQLLRDKSNRPYCPERRALQYERTGK